MVGHKRERVLGRVGRAVDAAARDFASLSVLESEVDWKMENVPMHYGEASGERDFWLASKNLSGPSLGLSFSFFLFGPADGRHLVRFAR